MPTKLSTIVSKISSIPNEKNRELVTAFHMYMKENGSSERHQSNQLKAAVTYAVFLGPEKTLFQVQKKDEVLSFLDTKIKSEQEDVERKWITTWNDYLNRIKFGAVKLSGDAKFLKNSYHPLVEQYPLLIISQVCSSQQQKLRCKVGNQGLSPFHSVRN